MRCALIALISLALIQLIAFLAAEALIVRSDPKSADVLVVLGGSSTYLERTHFAAKLFNEGRAPKIILTNDNLASGWSAEENRNPLFVERAVAELRQGGVPSEKVEIVPGIVSSTHDESVQIRRYADENQLKSILVVTSAYQSRRALWTIRRAFRGSAVNIGVFPVPPGEQSPRPAFWWSRQLGWKMVPGEYLKIAYYWVKY